MGHKCKGEWYTWSQADIESAKIAEPERYKGVVKVQSKTCDHDTCGKLLGERKEYNK